MNYVPLDIQSSYSIGKSICTIPKLVQKAREMGFPAIALTDDGFMFGAKEFYNQCRYRGGAYGELPSIKPIIGLSLRVFGDGAFHTLRLLAKDANGYHNLVRIASEGAMFEEPAEHLVDFMTVEKWHDGLICLTEETDGAFDVTVAPLVNAWGFGFKKNTMPDDRTVDSLLAIVGYKKIQRNADRLVKADPRIILDLSAVAKGFGSDQVARMFQRHGVENYMIEIGGAIVAQGTSPKGEAWRIGISRPTEDTLAATNDLQTVLSLRSCA